MRPGKPWIVRPSKACENDKMRGHSEIGFNFVRVGKKMGWGMKFLQ